MNLEENRESLREKTTGIMNIKIQKDSASTPENIVNSNTFLFSNGIISQSYAHMDSGDATFEYSNVFRGGLQFFGHTFLEGQDF